MSDYRKLSKKELIERIDLLQSSACVSENHLIHDLQVHQIKLEMQNRELREAQQQLEESRDRYADLYDFAPVGYLTLDESGCILEANLTVAAMLGCERAHLIGKPFVSWLPPGESSRFFDYLNQVFSSLANTVTELRIKDRSGALRDVNLTSAVVDGREDPNRCRIVMADISEFRHMAGSLQQTRSELDALLNAIPAIVFFKDLAQRYIRVNPFFADFFGLPVKEILGKADTELFPQEAAEKFQLSDRMVLDAGKTVSGDEQRFYDAQGKPHWLSTAKAPYFGPDGNFAGVVGVSKDVTAIRVAEQRSGELLRENRRLTRRLFTLQEKERLHLARELHDELGQWLTAIQAEAQAIRGMPCVAGKHDLLLSVQSIVDSAAQIHQVIRRILLRLRPTLLEQLGLMDSLRDLVEQWRRHYPGIAFELIMDGPLDSLNEVLNITVYRIVQEALTNIASHADASRVSINVHCAQDAILLAVEDNGKGMDTRRPRSGMGLLGIRERALAADGEFALNSAPGQGLRIDIEIPLSRLEEESEEFKQKD